MTFGGMEADEVVRVIDWLDEWAVVYQVNGGWAVDAPRRTQVVAVASSSYGILTHGATRWIRLLLRSDKQAARCCCCSCSSRLAQADGHGWRTSVGAQQMGY